MFIFRTLIFAGSRFDDSLTRLARPRTENTRGLPATGKGLCTKAGPPDYIREATDDASGAAIGQEICSLIEEKACVRLHLPPNDFVGNLIKNCSGFEYQGKIGASPQKPSDRPSNIHRIKIDDKRAFMASTQNPAQCKIHCC